jgi:hypothetical protein
MLSIYRLGSNPKQNNAWVRVARARSQCAALVGRSADPQDAADPTAQFFEKDRDVSARIGMRPAVPQPSIAAFFAELRMPGTGTARTMGALEWALLLAISVLWGGTFFFAEVALQEMRPWCSRIFSPATSG